MKNSARQVVDMMLEGGFEAIDYSPEDLERYRQLRAEQEQFNKDESFFDKTTGDLTPQWRTNWTEFEKLRNRYGGMPPKQIPPS